MTRATPPQSARHAVEDIARGSYGRLVAYLASVSGDLAAAEDALSEAFLAALRSWPERGVPDRPDSWLVTAARRTLIDGARRRGVAAKGLVQIARLLEQDAVNVLDDPTGGGIPDKRLELLFACTHPAIDPAMRAPLMLQTVLGLDAVRIGAAFLVAPATMGQRLVRVKAKIKAAGVPFAIPDAAQQPERVSSVLDAVYAAYGTGWDDRDDDAPADSRARLNAIEPGDRGSPKAGLVREALRLAGLLTELLPDDAEVHGLRSLLLHSDARSAARRSPGGAFVPLDQQDVGLWSRAGIDQAERHLATALRLHRTSQPLGPYQLQAAIQSVHNRRAATGRTDWVALAGLYDGLATLTPTVGACVARAKAHSHVNGPHAALALLDELPVELVDRYQPYWVVRAHCCLRAGDRLAAARAAETAIALTGDAVVRSHLTEQYIATDLGA